jgi:hypothetical protein
MWTTPLRPNTEQALQRDPGDWKTGDEPIRPAAFVRLETLSRDQGEPFRVPTGAEASNVSMS